MVDKNRLDDPHVKANLLFQVEVAFDINFSISFFFCPSLSFYLSIELSLSLIVFLLTIHIFWETGTFFSVRITNQRLCHRFKVSVGSKYTYHPGHDRYMCKQWMAIKLNYLHASFTNDHAGILCTNHDEAMED